MGQEGGVFMGIVRKTRGHSKCDKAGVPDETKKNRLSRGKFKKKIQWKVNIPPPTPYI